MGNEPDDPGGSRPANACGAHSNHNNEHSMKTTVKITIYRKRTEMHFAPVPILRQLLEKMQAEDPSITLEMQPNGWTVQRKEDVPTGRQEFNEKMEPEYQGPEGNPTRMTMSATLQAEMTLKELKNPSRGLLGFLQNYDIELSDNPNNTKAMYAVGWIKNCCPDTTERTALAGRIEELAKEAKGTDNNKGKATCPRIEVRARNIKADRKGGPQTRAIEIRAPADLKREALKVLCQERNGIEYGKFIPYALKETEKGRTAYKHLCVEQNRYLESLATIKLLNVTKAQAATAFTDNDGRRASLEERWREMAEVEWRSEGSDVYLRVKCVDHERVLQRVQSMVHQTFGEDSGIAVTNKRQPKDDHSLGGTTTNSYLTALTSQTNGAEADIPSHLLDVPRSRRPKLARTWTFDVADFPALQTGRKQNRPRQRERPSGRRKAAKQQQQKESGSESNGNQSKKKEEVNYTIQTTLDGGYYYDFGQENEDAEDLDDTDGEGTTLSPNTTWTKGTTPTKGNLSRMSDISQLTEELSQVLTQFKGLEDRMETLEANSSATLIEARFDKMEKQFERMMTMSITAMERLTQAAGSDDRKPAAMEEKEGKRGRSMVTTASGESPAKSKPRMARMMRGDEPGVLATLNEDEGGGGTAQGSGSSMQE